MNRGREIAARALSQETMMKRFALCRCWRIVPCVLVAVVVAGAGAAGCASPSSSPSEQKEFSSPDVAAKSLVDALRKEDEASLKKQPEVDTLVG